MLTVDEAEVITNTIWRHIRMLRFDTLYLYLGAQKTTKTQGSHFLVPGINIRGVPDIMFCRILIFKWAFGALVTGIWDHMVSAVDLSASHQPGSPTPCKLSSNYQNKGYFDQTIVDDRNPASPYVHMDVFVYQEFLYSWYMRSITVMQNLPLTV